MATSEQTVADPVAVRCSYHPDVETLLRCSRCGTPICPQCAVRTPVGMRCPACTGTAVRGALDPAMLARGAMVGLLVAVPVGILWGFAPAWGFYLALILGFGSVEAIARVTPGWRGPVLQFLAIAVAVVGIVLSRWVMGSRLGLDLAQIDQFGPRLQRVLYLRLIPDLLFMALPVAIAWVRFR